MLFSETSHKYLFFSQALIIIYALIKTERVCEIHISEIKLTDKNKYQLTCRFLGVDAQVIMLQLIVDLRLFFYQRLHATRCVWYLINIVYWIFFNGVLYE